MAHCFKSKLLKPCYDLARKFGQDQSSTFYHNGKPSRGASHRAAYWNGRMGQRNTYQKDSQCYAFWCAGDDDRKEFGTVEGAEFQWR